MSLDPAGLVMLGLATLWFLGVQGTRSRRTTSESRSLGAIGKVLGTGGTMQERPSRDVTRFDRMFIPLDDDVRKVQGEVHGVPVSVSRLRPPGATARVRVTRYVASGISRAVVIQPRGKLAALGETIGGRSLRTGDPVFDAAVIIDGDELALIAALDADARARIMAVFALHPDAKITGGEIHVDRPTLPTAPEEALLILQNLARAAAALTVQGKDLRARITRIVEHDPVPEVRAAALAALNRRLPGAETERFLCAMLTSASWQVQQVAAEALGDATTLVALAADDAVPLPTRIDLVETVLAFVDADVRDAAMEQLRRCEGGLIEALGEPDAGVRAAAARGLGHLGSVAAVEALNARTREGLGLGKVAAEAEKAIRAIQARAAGEGGRVAIVGEGGEVAVADGGGEVRVVGGAAAGEVDRSPASGAGSGQASAARRPLPKAPRVG